MQNLTDVSFSDAFIAELQHVMQAKKCDFVALDLQNADCHTEITYFFNFKNNTVSEA
jgi:hypothetical protein